MSLPVSGRFSSTKLSASNNSAVSMNNFEEFSSGLDTSGFLSSTIAGPERPVARDSRRRTRGRRLKKNLEVRGQGETPDWIRQLFGFAKKGNLERLVSYWLFTVHNNFLSLYGQTITAVVCSRYSWKYLFQVLTCEKCLHLAVPDWTDTNLSWENNLSSSTAHSSQSHCRETLSWRFSVLIFVFFVTFISLSALKSSGECKIYAAQSPHSSIHFITSPLNWNFFVLFSAVRFLYFVWRN